MYNQDTFFHLSISGRMGLVIVSLVMSAILLASYWWLTNRCSIPIKILLTFVFIWGFIWFSPQAYYLYYIQIIEGLPLQNVIQYPPSIFETVQTITFTGNSNLSNHSKGILFWAMMLIALRSNKELS